jgi:hypothetical protein
MTADHLLLLPVVLHVFLTLAIAAKMGRARFAAVRAGKVTREQIVNNSNAWPDDVLKISNNFNNQFQLPVFWYALTAFALTAKLADAVMVTLAWVFLGARIAHSIVQTGNNTLPLRFYVYLVGYCVLALMWLWFSLRYFMIG